MALEEFTGAFLHFLKKYVGASWADEIEEDDLVQIATTYVERDYGERESDIIYKLNSKNAYFYVLLEMQSETDFTMPFRLLRYMVNLLTTEFENAKATRDLKKFKLPAIIPIVLYNGEDNWTAVQSFKEYTSNYGDFGDNIINFRYLLFDLNRTDKETILTTRKLLDFIFAMDLKHTSQSEAEFYKAFNSLARMSHELSDDDIKKFVSWFAYAMLNGEVEADFEEKAVAALRGGGDENMTYALGRFMERERANAKQEGSREQSTAIARKMLNRARPIEEIIEDTGLTREEIEKLSQN